MLAKAKTKFQTCQFSELIYRFYAIPITNQTDIRNEQEQNLKDSTPANAAKSSGLTGAES